MQDKNSLNNILFIDLETVPLYQTFEELPERLKPLWEIKSKRITKDDEEKTPEQSFFE